MHDVVVIGAGQAGVAVSRFLVRRGIDHVVVDAQPSPGGAWQHTWPSLRLFSPAEASSLPGMLLPHIGTDFPTRDEVISYLRSYEKRYDLPILRPVTVRRVRPPNDDGDFELELASPTPPAPHTDPRPAFGPVLRSRVVVSATGTWSAPFLPSYPGRSRFRGEQLHSAQYQGPAPWQGARVGVVGAGNSAAQIAADMALDGHLNALHWFTLHPPRWLPEDVDGRDLFRQATADLQAERAGMGEAGASRPRRGGIVMVPPVREACRREAIRAEPMFDRIVETGVVRGGERIDLDVLVWATGFRPALRHLAGWGIAPALRAGMPVIRPLPGEESPWATRSAAHPRLFLVGYGDWTGAASATLIGVGRTARWTARAIERTVADGVHPDV